MGRSQETTSKKDKEKKRQKKRKDKEAKKEERKASSEGKKSFEDMLAYVDEDGRISSTPPDPLKKKQFKVEDIDLGMPKREEAEIPAGIRRGSVTFFNTSKGYGFIKDLDSQESIFVHLNGLVDSIKENDKVTFEVEMTPKGYNAIDVKISK